MHKVLSFPHADTTKLESSMPMSALVMKHLCFHATKWTKQHITVPLSSASALNIVLSELSQPDLFSYTQILTIYFVVLRSRSLPIRIF